MNVENHYATLQAHPSMTDLEIREHYRKLTRQHHPDKGGDAAAFAAVTAAYKAVGTARARAQYRARLALLAPMCGGCQGEGYTQRSKGFTAVETAPCGLCGGCGYVLAGVIRW